MNFTKLQGAGNDFILVEAGGVGQDWSPLAMAMCDRHFGIGADGLLLLLPSDTADFRMRVFNPDGSETEACGNGLRCLVRYVVDKGLLPKKLEGAGEILVDTMAGIRRAKIHKAKGKLTKIQVGMGTPKFEAEDIPVVVGQDVVDIKLPGGILGVEWDGVGEVFLSGPAEIVFTGEWPDEDRLSRVD